MKFVPVAGTKVLFSIWDTRVQDFEAFVKATQHAWEKPVFEQGPTHPVVMVSWDEAKAFCAWLTTKEQHEGRLGSNQTYRLPADWEWSVAIGLEEPKDGAPNGKVEKYALAHEEAAYPWGKGKFMWPPPRGAGNYGNKVKCDKFEYTSPVGSFPANQFGLFDMSGNVWQWCEDFFDGQSGEHVLRGGSWANAHWVTLRSSCRTSEAPEHRSDIHGFRIVLAASAP